MRFIKAVIVLSAAAAIGAAGFGANHMAKQVEGKIKN